MSQNANKFGLFSVANFVRPEERDIFDEFESGYLAELSPATLWNRPSPAKSSTPPGGSAAAPISNSHRRKT